MYRLQHVSLYATGSGLNDLSILRVGVEFPTYKGASSLVELPFIIHNYKAVQQLLQDIVGLYTSPI